MNPSRAFAVAVLFAFASYSQGQSYRFVSDLDVQPGPPAKPVSEDVAAKIAGEGATREMVSFNQRVLQTSADAAAKGYRKRLQYFVVRKGKDLLKSEEAFSLTGQTVPDHHWAAVNGVACEGARGEHGAAMIDQGDELDTASPWRQMVMTGWLPSYAETKELPSESGLKVVEVKLDNRAGWKGKGVLKFAAGSSIPQSASFFGTADFKTFYLQTETRSEGAVGKVGWKILAKHVDPKGKIVSEEKFQCTSAEPAPKTIEFPVTVGDKIADNRLAQEGLDWVNYNWTGKLPTLDELRAIAVKAGRNQKSQSRTETWMYFVGAGLILGGGELIYGYRRRQKARKAASNPQ